MAFCAKCSYKLEDGITKCPGCGASLVKPGAFITVLGWVLMVGALIPIIIGEETLDQRYYYPFIFGAGVLIAGIVLVLVGWSRSRSVEDTVRRDLGPGPGTP